MLGLDLGARFLRGAICDLRGEVRARHDVELPGADVQVVLDAAADLRTRLLKAGDLPAEALDGAVAGVPGVIESPSGQVGLAGNIPGLEGLRIGPALQERLGVPVTVENDVSLAARRRAVARHRARAGGLRVPVDRHRPGLRARAARRAAPRPPRRRRRGRLRARRRARARERPCGRRRLGLRRAADRRGPACDHAGAAVRRPRDLRRRPRGRRAGARRGRRGGAADRRPHRADRGGGRRRARGPRRRHRHERRPAARADPRAARRALPVPAARRGLEPRRRRGVDRRAGGGPARRARQRVRQPRQDGAPS